MPWPLQKPVLPQVDAGSWTHSFCGSVPTAMGPHSPLFPPPFSAEEHAWQVPVQAALQQTPSTQKPVEHWAFELHGLPVLIWQAPSPSQAPGLHSFAGS